MRKVRGTTGHAPLLPVLCAVTLTLDGSTRVFSTHTLQAHRVGLFYKAVNNPCSIQTAGAQGGCAFTNVCKSHHTMQTDTQTVPGVVGWGEMEEKRGGSSGVVMVVG